MPAQPAFLPYGRQSIDEDDVQAVLRALRSDWLTTGPAVAKFEDALRSYCQCADVVAVANGTAALHLAVQALGLGPGDAAIVPSVTFLATANCVRFVGAEVVFADVDPVSGLLTAESCAEAMARARGPVKAILPVHLGGRLVDVASIRSAAPDVAIIEDACHALGGAHHVVQGPSEMVGSCAHSDAAVFSFHPVKTITAGEGGAIACSSRSLADHLRRLRSHGMERDAGEWSNQALGFDGEEPNPWYYEMPEIGWNYRLTDIQCALGQSQLAKLDRFLAKRRALADAYDRALASLSNIVMPLPRLPDQESGWHLYQVAIDFAALGISRAALMQRLHQQGIGTQVHYIPVHYQPYYRQRYGGLALPGADAFYAKTLSLPFYPAMELSDVERVAAALRDVAMQG